jgi:pimeloyl-ACP methyl ester carboxylesterase
VHWHYRGHGRSAPPADPDRIDIAAHADDLGCVRRQVGDPPCVLFGHSMGCQVALEAYRQRPEGIRGLVLLCGSFGNVTSTFHNVPVLELVLPKLLDLALKAPDVVRAVWSRLPPQLALKIALKAGEIDPERVHPEDMLPYLSHMTHVDFPMFLRMLRAAGEHTAGDLLPDHRRPGARRRGGARYVHAAVPRHGDGGGDAARGAHDGAARNARGPHRATGARDARIEKFLRERVL